MEQLGPTTSASGGSPARNGGNPVTANEVHSQLDRIRRSPSFQRSERLQRFLTFVCEYTLKGEGDRLHEYLIGSEVFARGPNYAPHEDGIVRRQAHALRRKLQEYYEKDGAEDPVRIELPVGRYVPLFRRNSPAGQVQPVPPHAPEPESALAPVPLQAAPGGSRTVRVSWIIAGVLGIALFGAGWFFGTRTRPAAPVGTAVAEEVREIWGPWLEGKDGATLCFSNPLTAVIKHYPELLAADSQPPRQLLSPDQVRFFRSVVSLPPGGLLYFAPAISQAKMGEAFAAVYLTSLFAPAGVPMRATQSRFVSWEDLTRQNMILLGNNEANPWLDRILNKYPYQLTRTKSDKQRAIVISQPDPGEAGEFQIRYGDERLTATEEYALISMLPGVDGRHLLLLINGLNTQATQIAAEYLTTPERLKELSAELRKHDPSHAGPWNFQAVLRTEVHDKVPTKAALVSLKVIKE